MSDQMYHAHRRFREYLSIIERQERLLDQYRRKMRRQQEHIDALQARIDELLQKNR